MVLHNFLRREVSYLIVVGSSVPIGAFLRYVYDARLRKAISTALGILIAILFCGVEFFYSFGCTVLGTAMIKLLQNKNMPQIVFTFSFMYRIIFCLLTYFNTWRDERTLANGIQLVLTFKLICVAYEIGKYREKQIAPEENGQNKDVSAKRAINMTLPLLQEPSTIDIFCYLYCFLGLTSGPIFRYRTYQDMLNMPRHVSKSFPALSMVLLRIPIFIILLLISTVMGDVYPSDFMRSDEFYEETTFLYRLAYAIPVCYVGMSRYAVAWFLSEFGFTMAGLGVYPESKKAEPGKGPSSFSDNDPIWSVKENPRPVIYNIETIKNVHIAEGFTSATFAKTFRHWNCTAQWWLAHFIYSGKFLRGKPLLLRWIAVGIASAVWHGFRAGYYFSFVGMVYVAFAEHILLSTVEVKLHGISKKIFAVLHYVLFKALGIAFFMVTFILSNYGDIMRYLYSVYFGTYAIATISIIISAVFSVLPAQNVDKLNKSE